MKKRTHPARRARTAAGLTGATAYVGLLWVIAAESQAEATVSLDTALGDGAAAGAQPAAQTSLDLTGSATPVDGAAIDPYAVGAQIVPGQVESVDPAVATQPSAAATDPAAPVATDPAQTTATTVAGTPATNPPQQTAAPTTAAATTAAPTTAAPTTTAGSGGSQTTAAPTTQAPTTQPPTTQAPTTQPPTTAPTTTTSDAS